MLVEIKSKKLREDSVVFHNGLNVIQGDEKATNSIGKSSLLMIIDFAFGGDSLLKHNKDIVKELGEHSYIFIFKFEGKIYRYRRSTDQAEIVSTLNEQGEEVSILSLEKYTAELKLLYKITLEDISFRAIVGLFNRVWGKENLDVKKPLHVIAVQNNKDSINNFLKILDLFKSIKKLTVQQKNAETDRAAMSSAFKNNIVPKILKRDYKANEKKINAINNEVEGIKKELSKYAANLSEIVNREIVELKTSKDDLLEIKLRIDNKLNRIRKNLNQSRYIKSKNFDAVVKLFPAVNMKRLSEIEEFHDAVAKLLKSELLSSQIELEAEAFRVNAEIALIDVQMAETLKSIDKPEIIVDRVFKLNDSLKSATEENSFYDKNLMLTDAANIAKEKLSSEKIKVLNQAEVTVNESLKRNVLSIFGASKKSPKLTLNENSYSFDVFEDTGTGTAYVNLILLDLTIFEITAVPCIAHDSLLFKNIENDAVTNLFSIYNKIPKSLLSQLMK